MHYPCPQVQQACCFVALAQLDHQQQQIMAAATAAAKLLLLLAVQAAAGRHLMLRIARLLLL
jgi:hypothetical protein